LSSVKPQNAAPDPSMEDILASIRRILSEEEGGAKAAAAVPMEPEVPELLPSAAEDKADEDDTLELDMDMMVSEQPAIVDDPPDRLLEEPDEPPVPALLPTAAPMMVPEAVPAMISPAAAPAMMSPAAAPAIMAAEPLVAAEAAMVASSSIASLVSTLASERTRPVYRGGPTIEDLVREEIRPLLKLWLDNHLPPLVERLVRAEIERVVNRATP
jgi:cell pole-organizing protein PopZ